MSSIHLPLVPSTMGEQLAYEAGTKGYSKLGYNRLAASH